MIEIESMSFGEDFIVFNLEDSDEIKVKHTDLKNLSEDDDILLISRFGFGYKPIKGSFYKSLDKNIVLSQRFGRCESASLEGVNSGTSTLSTVYTPHCNCQTFEKESFQGRQTTLKPENLHQKIPSENF